MPKVLVFFCIIQITNKINSDFLCQSIFVPCWISLEIESCRFKMSTNCEDRKKNKGMGSKKIREIHSWLSIESIQAL